MLVTGATSGIGLAIATAFAAAGARVTATGATAAEVAVAAPRQQPGLEFAPLDVRDAGAVEALVAGSTTPVTKRAAGLAGNSTGPAMSSGVPQRPR